LLRPTILLLGNTHQRIKKKAPALTVLVRTGTVAAWRRSALGANLLLGNAQPAKKNLFK